jgi:hypothetical protein
LAKRLTRRGLLPLGGSLAVVLSENAASASVPTLLVISTVRTAALVATGQAMSAGIMTARVTVLMEGVLKTMLLNKLKTAMLFLLAAGVVGVGLGVSGSFYPTHAAEEKTAPVPVASDKSQANALEQQPTPRSALTGPRRSTGKQYLMQIQVFESAAAGGVRAASPCHRHAVREGEAESIILVGKTMPHDFGERNQENATIYEAVMAGISYVVKLRELSAGHLLLDLCLKKEDVEHHQKEKDGILIWGRTLQLLRKTEIGKLERFVLEKDNKGQPSSWVELVIIRDSDDHHTLLNHSGPLPFSDDRPNSPEKHSLKTELEGVWRPVRMEVSWFSLNWKIARFELASKG